MLIEEKLCLGNLCYWAFLITVLCLSGCGNAQELPGYNPKVVGNEMYKNDLMDKILNERIYKAISAGGDREEAEILFRLNEMTADQRRNLNYSISRAQYNAVTEVHMHTAEGGAVLYVAIYSF